MIPPEFGKVAEIVLEDMLLLKPKENLVILMDARTPIEIGHAYANVAISKGAETSLVQVPVIPYGRLEPPGPIRAALKEADAIVAMWIGYADCLSDAVERGVRVIGSLNGPDIPDVLIRTIGKTDAHKLSKEAEKIAELWTNANTAKITSPHGTDIEMNVKGITGFSLDGFLRPESGKYQDFLPPATPGIVDTVPANGKIALDGRISCGDLGISAIPNEPVVLTVEKSKITAIKTDRVVMPVLKYQLDKVKDPNVYAAPAHVIIGTNPNARLGVTWEWERFRGAMVFGFGNNYHLSKYVGQRPKKIETKAKIHWDGQIVMPTLYLDGELVIENGEIKI